MTTNPPTADGLVKNLRAAQRRVRSVLVANADRLDTPFTDDPGKNPWDTFVRPAMRELQDAVNAACEALTAVSSPPATDRAALLREAADRLEQYIDRYRSPSIANWTGAVAFLRSMAVVAQQQCPGYETVPNRCACGCEGCKHHCGAHNPEAQQQTDTEARHPSPRCTCGETACESELCDCDSLPCPVDHADEARQQPGTETRDDCCGAPPPELFIDEIGREWHAGDCWCTLPPDHDGQHRCQPCTDRVGAPGWGDEPAAGAGQDGAQQ